METKAKPKGNTVIGAVIILAFVGWSIQKCNKPKAHTEGSSNSIQTQSSDYACPHCSGLGKRINTVTGQYRSCGSCGGDGRVTQNQYDHLSK